MSLVHGPTIPSCIFVFLGITSTGISVNMIIHKLFECGLSTLWKIWDKIFIQDGFFFFSFTKQVWPSNTVYFCQPKKNITYCIPKTKKFQKPPSSELSPPYFSQLSYHCLGSSETRAWDQGSCASTRLTPSGAKDSGERRKEGQRKGEGSTSTSSHHRSNW